MYNRRNEQLTSVAQLVSLMMALEVHSEVAPLSSLVRAMRALERWRFIAALERLVPPHRALPAITFAAESTVKFERLLGSRRRGSASFFRLFGRLGFRLWLRFRHRWRITSLLFLNNEHEVLGEYRMVSGDEAEGRGEYQAVEGIVVVDLDAGPRLILVVAVASGWTRLRAVQTARPHVVLELLALLAVVVVGGLLRRRGVAARQSAILAVTTQQRYHAQSADFGWNVEKRLVS